MEEIIKADLARFMLENPELNKVIEEFNHQLEATVNSNSGGLSVSTLYMSKGVKEAFSDLLADSGYKVEINDENSFAPKLNITF